MSLEKYYLGEKEGYKWSEASFEFFYARLVLLDFIVEWWPCGELPVLSEGFKDRKYFFGNFHTSGDGGNNKNVEFLDFFSSCFESFLSDSLASEGVHRENCLWRLSVEIFCGDCLWILSVETVCGDSLNSLLRTGDYSRWKTIFSSFYELDQIILKIRMILRRKNDKIIWNIMRISLSL